MFCVDNSKVLDDIEIVKRTKQKGRKTMIQNETNLKACEEILEALKGNAVMPTNPIVTFDGTLRLTSSIHPLGDLEIVTFDSLEGFGDGWEDAEPQQVFDFIVEHCETFDASGDAYLKYVKRYDGDYALSVDTAAVQIKEGSYTTWDDHSLIMNAYHDQVGVGRIDCNDDESWIILTEDEMNSGVYDTVINFATTSAFIGGFLEEKTIIGPE